MEKTFLSGVKPTGRAHLGNYFGAMRQFVELQDEHSGLVMIADLHALTTAKDPAALRSDVLNLALDYLAIGLNPERVVLFRQSAVPEHAELAWIFSCLTTVPYLARAHAYKDALGKGSEPSAGLFYYPVLMAADILLYDPDLVPVGQDQKQHLEIARDLGGKFNRLYGEVFKLPEPLTLVEVETVPGVDGRKMSKSYGNTIPLFAEPAELKRAVMSIVTDSAQGRPENVYAIHKLVKSEAELAPFYEQNAGKYQVLKEALIADLEAFIAPLRARRAEFEAEPARVVEILATGATRARNLANAKMARVRELIGL